MLANSSRTRGPLFSTLADDPEMAPLVEEFVEGLADRVELLVDRLQASDNDALRRVAHQMVGSAGSYGFHEITVDAATLETALREGRPEEEIAGAVNSLIDLCRRARAGTGDVRPGPNPTG